MKSNMRTIEEIRFHLECHKPVEEAVEALTEYIAEHPDSDEALTLRGRQYWALGKRGAAITDYLAAIKINPDSPSRRYIKVAYEILNYYNKDLYNP